MPVHISQSAVVYLILMLAVVVIGLMIVTQGKITMITQTGKLSKMFDQGSVKLVGDTDGTFPEDKIQFEFEQKTGGTNINDYRIKSIVLKSAAFNYEGPGDKIEFSLILDVGGLTILGKDDTKLDAEKHVLTCVENQGMQCESPRDIRFDIPYGVDQSNLEGLTYLHFTVWQAKTVPTFCVHRNINCMTGNGYEIPKSTGLCERCLLIHRVFCENQKTCVDEGQTCDGGLEPITDKASCPEEEGIGTTATIRDFLDILPEYYLGSFGLTGVVPLQKLHQYFCGKFNEADCKLSENCYWYTIYFSKTCKECSLENKCNNFITQEACSNCNYAKGNCLWSTISQATACWSKSYVESENECIQKCKNSKGLCDEATCQSVTDCWFKFDNTCNACPEEKKCNFFVKEDCDDANACGANCVVKDNACVEVTT
jgi:hypothetical protein